MHGRVNHVLCCLQQLRVKADMKALTISVTKDRSPKQQVFVEVDVPKMPYRPDVLWLNSMHHIGTASSVTC